MTITQNNNMYNMKYDIEEISNHMLKNNRLFCTFTNLEGVDPLVFDVSNKYSIMYNKIFVLFIKSTNEYAVTYNIDQGNIDAILHNTILLHRKKESNSLYSINALNELVKSLNNGSEDRNYPIDWNNYKNCILLTQQNILKVLNTKIFKIIQL